MLTEFDELFPEERAILQEARDAQKKLDAAVLARTEMLGRYAKRRPLTAEEIEMMVARITESKPICCEDGLIWLRQQLPTVWAESINVWAYEALGCMMPDTYAKEHMRRVRALKLDVLPNVEAIK